jgi:hypothetical protein
MLKFVPLAIVAATAVPAVAQTTAPAAQTQAAAPAKQDPLDKIVCRYEETIGSRLKSHKVCATVREWREQQEENQDAVQRMQQNKHMDPTQ